MPTPDRRKPRRYRLPGRGRTTCYRAAVPIHRTIRRPWALALGFTWLYAISLIAFVVIGPIMLGLIAALIDGDSAADAVVVSR